MMNETATFCFSKGEASPSLTLTLCAGAEV